MIREKEFFFLTNIPAYKNYEVTKEKSVKILFKAKLEKKSESAN